MTGYDNFKTAEATGQSPEEWRKGWTTQMLVIWREKLKHMEINDTGNLERSLSAHINGNGKEGQSIITHRFEMYGLYVDAGTGRGFTHGNGGQLDILDKSYRKAKGMTSKPREPRHWFSFAYYRSVKNLIEHEAQVLGEKFVGVVAKALAGQDDKNRDVSKYL